MKNKIEDLRNHLFAALEALADDEKPMEVSRARAISEVAGKIIESARVENDFLKITGANRAGSNFLPSPEQKSLPTPGAQRHTG